MDKLSEDVLKQLKEAFNLEDTDGIKEAILKSVESCGKGSYEDEMKQESSGDDFKTLRERIEELEKENKKHTK